MANTKVQIPEPYKGHIEKFQEFVVQQTHESVIEDNSPDPTIFVLFEDKNDPDGKPGLAVVPIPGELLNSGTGKDILTDIIVPKILAEMRNKGQHPFCISFLTEAWQWQTEGLTREQIEEMGWEEIKRTRERMEIVIITFDTEWGCTARIFEKKGTKKNEKGEFIEGTYMEERVLGSEPEMEGRFSSLLKKKSPEKDPALN
jgi:hypothetical protein